ncbi:MAG: hypothetical protein WD054_06870, partial [Gemmatimonadota bacterium]
EPGMGRTTSSSASNNQTPTSPGTKRTEKRIGAAAGGAVVSLLPTDGDADVGAPVLLYQVVTYKFAPIDGQRGLFRRVHEVHAADDPEPLVWPFNDTARFRFYVNSDTSMLTAAPSDVIGFELVLDGVSERPNSDGTHQVVPLRTSVFFKN